MKGFAAAQRAYDNQSPPEYDDSECPECGACIHEDDDGWKCDECDWSVYPDYEEAA